MENNNFNFDLNEVKDEQGYEPLRAGDYSAMITASEFRSPKSGGADYLHIEYTMIDENDRKAWEVLSINSANDTAKNISRSRLKAICKACDLDLSAVNNPEQLLHKSLTVTLGIKKDADYGDKNIVKKVSAMFNEAEAVVDTGDKIPF